MVRQSGLRPLERVCARGLAATDNCAINLQGRWWQLEGPLMIWRSRFLVAKTRAVSLARLRKPSSEPHCPQSEAETSVNRQFNLMKFYASVLFETELNFIICYVCSLWVRGALRCFGLFLSGLGLWRGKRGPLGSRLRHYKLLEGKFLLFFCLGFTF